MNRKFALSALCLLPLVSYSVTAEEEEKPEFTASAELGFLYKTGNTKSADMKTGFKVKYEKDLWLSLLNFDLLVKKTDNEAKSFETSDQKWSIDSKTNYTLSTTGKNYVYGNIRYEDDRFSSFDSQSSVSAGWGRHWYKTDKASLFADVGPGFKSDKVKATGKTQNAFIIQAQALYLRQINEHVEFQQTLSAKVAPKSGENSIYSAESSITTKLIETLQLKFSFKLDHNTEVSDDKKNTDTQTALTLVYSF
jgi:putative salt-induced outer membrane protein YdiY